MNRITTIASFGILLALVCVCSTSAQDPDSSEPLVMNLNSEDSGITDQQDQMTDPLTVQEIAQREFGKWPRKKIHDISLDIRLGDAKLPTDQSSQLINSNPVQWTEFTPTSKVFAWAAPDIRYQPLYFEDVALERYGQTRPPFRQSMASGVHFFRSLVFLPNEMRHDCPVGCDYPLGFCRPGNSVPCTYQYKFLGLHRR